jgi:tetratricopeptide (TPR) repeat protein
MRRTLLAVVLALAARPAAGQAGHGLTDQGLDSLRHDVAIDSVDAQAYYRLGLGLWEKHKLDEAETAFQRALHFQPWHAGAHLALAVLPSSRSGRYWMDLGHRITLDSARAIRRTILQHRAEASVLDPRSDLAPLGFLKDDELVTDHQTINLAGFQFSTYFDVPALKAMRRAMRELIDQRPDSAFDILAAALAARRHDQTMNDEFIALYATSALRSGHPDAAADGYRELAERAGRREAASHGTGPFDPGPAYNVRGHFLLLYGIAEAEAGKHQVARAAFREALLTDLTFYQAHARLADLAEEDGDLEAALAERQAAIAVAPETARPYLDLGITLLQAGRAREAEDALTEAVVRLPWDPGAQLFLFQAAMTTGDRPAAQRALTALDLFAPRRNHDQVVEAHRRFDEGTAR